MLKNKVMLNNREYSIREGSYSKKRANAVVPRFANTKLDISDLTIWNWWAQSLWHGGFDQENVLSDPPIGFFRSENIDSMYKIGSLKLAKNLTGSIAVSGITAPRLAAFIDSGTRYLYYAGQRLFGMLKLWRTTTGANIASAWADVSGGKVHCMAPEFNKLFLGVEPSFGTYYLKYTIGASVINDTNWASANGIPHSIIGGADKLWLLTKSGLYDYDDTTPTQRVARDSGLGNVGGNKGQQLAYDGGDVYWIDYITGFGKLYKYDISADADAMVYQWKTNFEPKFIIPYKNKLIIGGKDLNVLAAAVYEFDPINETMREVKTWENADNELVCHYGHELNGILLITIQGSDGVKDYIYAYNGINLSEYIVYDLNISDNNAMLGSHNNYLFLTPGTNLLYSAGANQFQTSGALESSRIDFDLFGVQKYFGGLTVYHKPLPANCVLKLKQRVDSTSHWSGITVAGSNNTADSVAFDIELLSSNIGKKIEYYLYASGAAAKEIETTDITIRYLLLPESKYEWTFDLLLVDNIEGGNTAEQMKSDLEKAIDDVLVNFRDVGGELFDVSKEGTTDRGVVVENINFLGPKLHGNKVEFVARVHLLEG